MQASPSELQAITQIFLDRDSAIRRGMVVGGTRYEVHRHHPPAIYGRTMGANIQPEQSEGAAVVKSENPGANGEPTYAFITYLMPNVSARMVPILQRFVNDHLSSTS